MGDLYETLASAHRSYAAFRPEVARYLFEKGWKRLTGDPKLLEAIFRLQMESIGSCAFGVSSDAWRDNPEWPDRYFPILWIDLLPKLLPLLPPARALSCITLLFNVGENLVTVAPTLGGAVAELLLRDVDALARDPERAVIRALVQVGVVPGEQAVEQRERSALSRVARVSLAAWEPTLIPGAVAFDGDAFLVADVVRPLVLRLKRTGASAQLLGRLTSDRVAVPSMPPLAVDGLALSSEGEVSYAGTAIGRIDLRGVAGVALGPHGLIVVSRRFSQSVELWSAA